MVGDDDQAIYRFRSAEPRNILEFGCRYPKHAQVVLGRNFRSRAEILGPAATCIAHNERRHPKALVAMRGSGGRVTTRGFARERDEASWVAGLIGDELGAGTPPIEVLVLGRTAFATAPVQSALAAAGIPHRVLGSLGLYERAEVSDALSYVALLRNPRDAHAFRRAIQAPRRGVGTATIGRVVAAARETFGGDLIATAANAVLLGEHPRPRCEVLMTFGAGLDLRSRAVPPGPIARSRRRCCAHRPGRHRFPPRGTPRPVAAGRRTTRRRTGARGPAFAVPRRADLRRRRGCPSLGGFLEHAAGLHAEEIKPGRDRRITVSTIHRAKGTEAQLVALLGCEEQLLPSWRSLQSADPEDLEEERRLFYVAATRAKDHLVLTPSPTGPAADGRAFALSLRGRSGAGRRALARAGRVRHSKSLRRRLICPLTLRLLRSRPPVPTRRRTRCFAGRSLPEPSASAR